MRGLTKLRRPSARFSSKPGLGVRRFKRSPGRHVLRGRGEEDDEDEAIDAYRTMCLRFFPIIIHLLALRWLDPVLGAVCRNAGRHLLFGKYWWVWFWSRLPNLTDPLVRRAEITNGIRDQLPYLRTDEIGRNYISTIFAQLAVKFRVVGPPELQERFDKFELHVWRPCEDDDDEDERIVLEENAPTQIGINWDIPDRYGFLLSGSTTAKPDVCEGFMLHYYRIHYRTMEIIPPPEEMPRGGGVSFHVSAWKIPDSLPQYDPDVVLCLTLGWPWDAVCERLGM